MADMITGAALRELKARHPGAAAVCYVNSTAEVKAECDICVTSGNARRVMSTFPPEREIIFVPDRHLGSHVAAKLGREYILWPGYCPTHARLTAKAIADARAAHPEAIAMVHPECPKEVRDAADLVLSTGEMCAAALESDAKEFLVGTETGIIHRLERENPGKKFYPVDTRLVCPNMKKTTLEKVRDALRDMKPRVTVPPATAAAAKRAIDAMLSI